MTGSWLPGARWPVFRRTGIALAVAAVLMLPAPASAQKLLADGTPVAVKTKPFDRFHIGRPTTRFGPLVFLGGFEILSSDRNIGGLSGLLSLDSGRRILAITDNGQWVTGDVIQADDGTPSGLENVRVAAMRGADGKTLRGVWGHDTEALTRDGDTLLVAAERANKIYRFPWPLVTGGERMLEELDLPEDMRRLRASKGLEALATAPAGTPLAGTLVAIAERGPSEAHDLPGFLMFENTVDRFQIARSGRYDATDAVFLPTGDLLLLERRFNLRDLVGMRLRLFGADSIVPGARLEGETLLEADYGYQIDNMEALAVHRNAAGEVILTLLSDNNRSLLQRTVLLRFRLEN